MNNVGQSKQIYYDIVARSGSKCLSPILIGIRMDLILLEKSGANPGKVLDTMAPLLERDLGAGRLSNATVVVGYYITYTHYIKVLC